MSYYYQPKKMKYTRRRPARGGRLGRGAMTKWRNYQGQQFVPRTLGALAASESKYFDSYLNSSTLSETTSWIGTELDPATLNTLFFPAEGADINERIGRRVSVYKIAIRGQLKTTAVAASGLALEPCYTRLVLYQDMQTNGTQSQGEQVMAQPGTTAVPLVISTFQNPANFGRFRVLRDITVRSPFTYAFNDAAGTGAIAASNIPIKITYRFKKPVVVKFNATGGGSVGDIVDNSFHLIGKKSGADFAQTISYQCRVYYKDL